MIPILSKTLIAIFRYPTLLQVKGEIANYGHVPQAFNRNDTFNGSPIQHLFRCDASCTSLGGVFTIFLPHVSKRSLCDDSADDCMDALPPSPLA